LGATLDELDAEDLLSRTRRLERLLRKNELELIYPWEQSVCKVYMISLAIQSLVNDADDSTQALPSPADVHM
jgi:hypothetical protein